MVQHAQQETKHYYVCATEYARCVHVHVHVYVGVCLHMGVCVCVASQQEEETGAYPLLSAALIYLDVHDVILPGGLPCQA